MPITEEQRLARNAKAREAYARKKAQKEADKAVAKKAEEKQKKLQTLKEAVGKIKAGQTIVGAIKRKLATPKKKREDTNRLNNLPEDLQKKIMTLTKRRIDTNMVKIELPMKELVKYLKQFPNVLSFIARQGYTMQEKVPFRYKPYLRYNLFIIDYDDGKEYVFKVGNEVDEMYSAYLYDNFYRKSKKGVNYDLKGLDMGSSKGSSKGSNTSKISSRSSGRSSYSGSSSGSTSYTSSGSSASPISVSGSGSRSSS